MAPPPRPVNERGFRRLYRFMKSKELLKLCIYGDPRTKKNCSSIYINKATEKRFVTPSTRYKAYEAEFKAQVEQVKSMPENPIDVPVEVKVIFYMKTRRKVDLTNLLEATDDALVASGVLLDDCCRIVVSHDGSRVMYDKEKPRAEITISQIIDFHDPFKK